MKLIVFLLKQSRRMVVLAAVAGVVAGLSSTGFIALVHRAVISASPSSRWFIWSFIGLCLLALISGSLSQIWLNSLGQNTIYDLRMQLCRRILATPLRRLEEVGAPRLLASLTDDVSLLSGAVLMVPGLCVDLTIVISCLIYEAWLDWVVLLVMLVFMFFAVTSYQLPTGKAMQYFNLAREQVDALFKHFRAMIEGNKELKLHRRRQGFFGQLLSSTASSVRGHNMTALTIYAITHSWGQLLFFISIGIVLFALPSLKSLSAETLTGYTLVGLFMMGPIRGLLVAIPNLARANVSLQRVEELGLSLAAPVEEPDSSHPLEPSLMPEPLRLVGVTHAYHGDQENGSFTLGPIDLTLHPGELVFLVGGNGSGKTTLAKLLTGLYTPEAGEIRFNGQLITDENREEFRQNFSAVFSDFFLFESLLGLDSPHLDERAHHYLDQLQLSHKVQVSDGQLSTTELSQGQRKRLALLTAFLEDRPVYVFDEWAADQDPMFKKVFYYQILPELKARGKTVIVISHDDRYYHVGDRIIKLDSGQLVYDKPLHHAQATPLTPVLGESDMAVDAVLQGSL
jgi:putative ATP-binding cassette transporter